MVVAMEDPRDRYKSGPLFVLPVHRGRGDSTFKAKVFGLLGVKMLWFVLLNLCRSLVSGALC